MSASDWPRTYRVAGADRVLVNLCCAALVIVGVAQLVWGAWNGGGSVPMWMRIVAAIAMVTLGGATFLAVHGAEVVLREEAIEFVEWGCRRRRFRKGEIAGRRVIPLQNGQRKLVLELRMGRKPFRTGWYWKEDEAFTAWLAALPDLDAEERARARPRR